MILQQQQQQQQSWSASPPPPLQAQPQQHRHSDMPGLPFVHAHSKARSSEPRQQQAHPSSLPLEHHNQQQPTGYHAKTTSTADALKKRFGSYAEGEAESPWVAPSPVSAKEASELFHRLNQATDAAAEPLPQALQQTSLPEAALAKAAVPLAALPAPAAAVAAEAATTPVMPHQEAEQAVVLRVGAAAASAPASAAATTAAAPGTADAWREHNSHLEAPLTAPEPSLWDQGSSPQGDQGAAHERGVEGSVMEGACRSSARKRFEKRGGTTCLAGSWLECLYGHEAADLGKQVSVCADGASWKYSAPVTKKQLSRPVFLGAGQMEAGLLSKGTAMIRMQRPHGASSAEERAWLL
eukprot:scaffold67012_cov18-Tisochrysis_lutea.AAC.6